jgi:hypothetical protein
LSAGGCAPHSESLARPPALQQQQPGTHAAVSHLTLCLKDQLTRCTVISSIIIVVSCKLAASAAVAAAVPASDVVAGAVVAPSQVLCTRTATDVSDLQHSCHVMCYVMSSEHHCTHLSCPDGLTRGARPPPGCAIALNCSSSSASAASSSSFCFARSALAALLLAMISSIICVHARWFQQVVVTVITHVVTGGGSVTGRVCVSVCVWGGCVSVCVCAHASATAVPSAHCFLVVLQQSKPATLNRRFVVSRR